MKSQEIKVGQTIGFKNNKGDDVKMTISSVEEFPLFNGRRRFYFRGDALPMGRCACMFMEDKEVVLIGDIL